MQSDSLIGDLGVFYDDEDVLKVGGRLNAAEMSYTVQHRIILPSRHPITERVFNAAHRRLLHGGTLETLTELREIRDSARKANVEKGAKKMCDMQLFQQPCGY
ncbi:hypothetical protein MRX96_002332 [Rhipicephalus microplus]